MTSFLEAVLYRIKIKTEGKAKVVTAACGTEFIQFIATLVILHKIDLKKRLNGLTAT